MKKIAVIGAGITGITTAYSLLERGYDVTVFDRNRYAAMETSFANGGQLSASNAEVWTNWGTVLKGLKWMFEPGAPLLMNPKPSWHKYSWMAEFMANIPKYETNTIETVRLAISARQHLKRFAEKEGFDFDVENRGILHVYRDQKEFDHARRVNDLLAKGGLNRHEVSAEGAYAVEPTIKCDLTGGFYTDSDFSGDIHLYAKNLAKACSRRGVKFHYNTEITIIGSENTTHKLNWFKGHEKQEESFDSIVVCAGVSSRAIAQKFGDRVNIYPVKGYSITVNLNDHESQAFAPRVSLLDDKAKIVASRLGDDRFRIAGTAEFNGYNRDIRDDRIRPLIQWCEEFFPQVSTEHAVPWAGLRPMMPSMLPKVAPGKKSGVFYNTGHGHLGWTLSAATSEIISDMITSHFSAPNEIENRVFAFGT
ncbi:MAG: D-amino acid dehydrogenase [Lentilitoribacter sp.]